MARNHQYSNRYAGCHFFWQCGQRWVPRCATTIFCTGRAQVSFTVPRDDLQPCLLLVREVISAWEGAELSYETEITKLTVMGIGLRTHTGVGDRMFRALAAEGINVQMINTSEIRISVVVAPDRGAAAHACLLKTFGLG